MPTERSQAELMVLRERILDAALQVIGEVEYLKSVGSSEARFDLRRVADKAGLRRPDLLLLFENKEALLAALQERARLNGAPDLHLPSEMQDAVEQLKAPESIKPMLLESIGRLVAQSELLTQRIDETVSQARAVGATWAEVGEAAGIKPQSAHERWRKKAEQINR